MLVRVLQSDNAVKFGEALLGVLLLVTFSSSTQGMDLKTTFYRPKKKSHFTKVCEQNPSLEIDQAIYSF